MAIKEGSKFVKPEANKARGDKAEELKTDGPLSEKDEVKQAEENTQKQQNKGK